jgi:hypothetical protein
LQALLVADAWAGGARAFVSDFEVVAAADPPTSQMFAAVVVDGDVIGAALGELRRRTG